MSEAQPLHPTRRWRKGEESHVNDEKEERGVETTREYPRLCWWRSHVCTIHLFIYCSCTLTLWRLSMNVYAQEYEWWCSIKRAGNRRDSPKGHRRWDQIYTKMRNNQACFQKNPWCYGIHFPLRSGQKRIMWTCVQNVGDTLNSFCEAFKPISRACLVWRQRLTQ